MEHVLRQCLIALKLAERAGLDEESRAAVYYTALLVNIGCHTDAHEQAKWCAATTPQKVEKVRLRHAQRARGGVSDEVPGFRAPAAAPVPAWYRICRIRPSRAGRHDRPSRQDDPAARRTARHG